MADLMAEKKAKWIKTAKWIYWTVTLLFVVTMMSAGVTFLAGASFNHARREVLKVHPRGNVFNPLTGVFSTRSPDRPNPLGLHRVKVLEINSGRLHIGPIEAIDGTPVIDIKPVVEQSNDY